MDARSNGPIVCERGMGRAAMRVSGFGESGGHEVVLSYRGAVSCLLLKDFDPSFVV